MTDLIEFLRARLDEDEAVAQAATAGPWEWVPDGRDGDRMLVAPTVRHSYETAYSSGSTPEQVIAAIGMNSEGWVSVEDWDAEHIARWDPIRVLAEIAAKRLVLADHEYTDVVLNAYGPSAANPHPIGCMRCHDWDGVTMGLGWCLTVRALSLPYADHPEFDPAWEPS